MPIKMGITISDNVSMTVESQYLLISNREKCHKILLKNEKDRNDIIDFLISLHLVLEIGLNGFYRKIILNQLQKTIRITTIANDLDSVSFIEKTVMFFTLPKFDFQDKINEADKYYDAIGKIRNFSEIRNKLLHGHAIMEISSNGTREQSRAFELLTEVNLQAQVNNFKFIMEAVEFYFEHMKNSNFTEHGKNSLKKQFLYIDFLNI